MMNRCVALFTGGKESVFSILRAKEHGHKIEELIFLEKPGFSVHKLNLPAVRAIAKILGLKLITIKTGSKSEEDENLITYLRRKRENGITGLLTGNVKLEELHDAYQRLCKKADLELIEPLKGWDTLELLIEYPKIGLQFMIIGIRDAELDLKWLGRIITQENFEEFLIDILSRGIDPCGEYGEYHSLVIGLRDVKVDLKLVKKGKDDGNVNYVLTCVPEKF